MQTIAVDTRSVVRIDIDACVQCFLIGFDTAKEGAAIIFGPVI
jgi:hypothetical protein